jgi:hypothetical protein
LGLLHQELIRFLQGLDLVLQVLVWLSSFGGGNRFQARNFGVAVLNLFSEQFGLLRRLEELLLKLLGFRAEFGTPIVGLPDLLLPHVLLLLEDCKGGLVFGLVQRHLDLLVPRLSQLFLQVCFSFLLLSYSLGELLHLELELRVLFCSIFLHLHHLLVQVGILALDFSQALTPTRLLLLQFFMHLFQSLKSFCRFQQVVQEFLSEGGRLDSFRG